MVTHNIPSARVIGDDFAVLHEGRMLAHGTLRGARRQRASRWCRPSCARREAARWRHPARLAGIGVFVLGGLLLFTVGLFMIGDRQMAFAKKVTIYTEFKKITGLQPGGIVRVSGAKAGAITKIVPPSTPGGKFRVEFEITEDAASAGAHWTRSPRSKPRGSSAATISASAAAPTPRRRRRPARRLPSKEPFEIAELMQQMGDTIVKVNATIQTVNDVIDEMKVDVQRAVVVGRRHHRSSRTR